MYGELVGMVFNDMAVKCGGHKWADEIYGEDAEHETAIVAGKIICWKQGTPIRDARPTGWSFEVTMKPKCQHFAQIWQISNALQLFF